MGEKCLSICKHHWINILSLSLYIYIYIYIYIRVYVCVRVCVYVRAFVGAGQISPMIKKRTDHKNTNTDYPSNNEH